MSTKAVALSIIFKLPISVKKQKVGYISSCPVFDVWSQGKNKKEAEKNIKEAVSLFIVSCFERGTLDQVFKDCGFHPLHKPARKKPAKRNGTRTIEIPIPFNVNNPSPATPCRA